MSPNHHDHDWALVLAGGEGTRLQLLTRMASGVAVPKQFCSLGHSGSLLHDAVARAGSVATAERITVVVSEHHRKWWQGLDLHLPASNIFSQPGNRGTAQGILLPLLQILHRDPEARLLVLPSDHYVSNEPVLANSLRVAMQEVVRNPADILLLGMAAEEADAELGYIVADAAAVVSRVCDFVEKPDAATARELIARGGVWNSFIFAANGRSLLRRFEAFCPDLAGEMQYVVNALAPAEQTARLAELYARSPGFDFSRDILQRCTDSLRVLKVPACGWSDLGTPRRVIETVQRIYSRADGAPLPTHGDRSAFLNLAGRSLDRYATG